MRKTLADEMRSSLDQLPHFDFISTDINQSLISKYNSAFVSVGIVFKAEISDFALDRKDILWSEEDGELVCAYWFSRGMEDTCIVLNIKGGILAIESSFPKRLLRQISEILEDIFGDQWKD
jgi:hypothetical protein